MGIRGQPRFVSRVRSWRITAATNPESQIPNPDDMRPMTSFKITVAYDGTGFVGWQRQAAGTSIQGMLEDALRPLAGCDVAVAGAGRTDAGVHAIGQVASFAIERTVDTTTVVRALNARLPPEVRVIAAEEAPAGFHARFSARAKSYRYRIRNAEVDDPFDRRYAWHLPGPLDVDAMACAATLVEGEHDFAAFQAAGSDAASTVRRVVRSRIAVSDTDGCRGSGRVITYDTSGAGYLRHMVRAIVGSLVDVGRGRRPADWIGELLTTRDRAMAGRTAPAHGLFLVSVDYGISTLAAEP
jgi:tRNA pseudouridine38-40 synthase